MPCGCSQKNQSSGWLYCDAVGHCTSYPSEVEAKAAMIRAGNTGSVKAA